MITVTEPRPVELEPLGAPEPCRHCRDPIVNTVLGLTHVDPSGAATTWFCPGERMRLAEPDLLSPAPAVAPEPASPEPRWRRMTPIPPLRDVGQARPSPRPAPPAEPPQLRGAAPWQNPVATRTAGAGP